MGSAKYRVAIVGAGRIGGLLEGERPPSAFRKPHSHFASYNAVDETEVVAVAGRSEGRLQMFTERYGITNLYTDYREMIEKERPDIVSVTTQTIHKAEVITFAAEQGVRGIFAEKALCSSLEEADRIRDAVNANGGGLQLRRGATAPRRLPTAARGDSARRHRRAEVRILLLAHRPHEAPLAHDRHAGVPIGGPSAGLGGGEARTARRPAGRRKSQGSPRGHGHAPASAAPADAERCGEPVRAAGRHGLRRPAARLFASGLRQRGRGGLHSLEPRDRVRDTRDRGPRDRMGRRRGHSPASQGWRQRHRGEAVRGVGRESEPSPPFATSSTSWRRASARAATSTSRTKSARRSLGWRGRTCRARNASTCPSRARAARCTYQTTRQSNQERRNTLAGFITRPVVTGRKGVVTSGHYLATAAGFRIMENGGNAIDAAAAMCIAVDLMEPQSCGIGGEVPTLVYPANEGQGIRPQRHGMVAAGVHDRLV